MASHEIDCDICWGHKEGAHSSAVKTICNDCWKEAQKQIQYKMYV